MEGQLGVRVESADEITRNQHELILDRCKGLRRWFVASSTILSLVLGVGLSLAADVLGFAAAANQGQGCNSIPYPVAAAECRDYQRDKDKMCKDYGHQRSEVEKLIKTIEEKKKSLDEARKRNNKAVIPDLEKAISEACEKVKGIQAKAAGKILVCNECIAARKRVQRVFSEVKTKVQAETDSELQPYIPALVKKIRGRSCIASTTHC